MPYSYTKKELTDFFYESLHMFNSCLDSDINKDNVLLEFFAPENGVKIYERFCKSHFPKLIDEPYKTPGYFETFCAQAFVNETQYGVLIREDIDFSIDDLLLMFLHELAHLYCTKNEIEGGNFFDKYCTGSGIEDGMMNAGYAIWREAIADIMADSIAGDGYALFSLAEFKKVIIGYYNSLSIDNPSSKKAMSLIIAYTMISKEVSVTEDWSKAEKEIKRILKFDDPVIIALLKMVFDKLHRSPYWEITSDFIIELGKTYLELLSNKTVMNFQNAIRSDVKRINEET